MGHPKLDYHQLDEITHELFEKIDTDFTPDIIVHPGIRTRYLAHKAKDHFHTEPYIIDTKRALPFKQAMRKIFYEMFDYVPSTIARPLTEVYIKSVHSESRQPRVIQEHIENIPRSSSVLILDDVFCTGHTVKAVADALEDIGVKDIRSGVLIFAPYNGKRPDYHILEGMYSLPWRNIGI